MRRCGPTTSMGGGILTPNGSAASIGEGTQRRRGFRQPCSDQAFPVALVPPLSRPFLSFGERSLSALLRPSLYAQGWSVLDPERKFPAMDRVAPATAKRKFTTYPVSVGTAVGLPGSPNKQLGSLPA